MIRTAASAQGPAYSSRSLRPSSPSLIFCTCDRRLKEYLEGFHARTRPLTDVKRLLARIEVPDLLPSFCLAQCARARAFACGHVMPANVFSLSTRQSHTGT